MDNYRFILSGGGTGGHIYPAIAIADELKRRNNKSQFLFVGAKDKMEMEKVPQAGYEIKGLWISGLQRKLTLKNLLFPVKLLSSLFNARKIVKHFRPHLVVGTGGFASGPLAHMATKRGVPTVLQEQNSFAGITNKLLAKKAESICVAYEGMERFFPQDKVVLTGNPVRADLVTNTVAKSKALQQFEITVDKPVLLVLGGSLGSRRINQLIESKLSFFKAQGIQVLWQCGKMYYNEYRKYDAKQVKVHAFLKEMDCAYSAADIVISRAGAGSVSELCLVGKPVLFIPSPNVAEDHQTHNAMALVSKNAALMLKESELEKDFETVFTGLIASKEQQNQLAQNIKELALPKATERIVDEIERILEKNA